MLSTDSITSFMPLVAGMALIMAGTLWMYIEGFIARKNPTKYNNSRENRIVIAIIIAALGIIVVAISGFMLVAAA